MGAQVRRSAVSDVDEGRFIEVGPTGVGPSSLVLRAQPGQSPDRLPSRGKLVCGAAATATALCCLLAGCAPAAASPSGAVSSVEVQPRSASSDPVTGGNVEAQADTRMLVSIPSIGVHDLLVVAYVGHADDLPGTRIEDRGLAASPRGRLGGVAPGVVGNLLITGHRTSAGGPLRLLPSLRSGAHILISSGGLVYDYVVTGTMTVSFRTKASLALQSAAVPGHPGLPATRAMITLSTCATPEDHAAGDYWADALGNPEHRIDKVGVLLAIRAR